MNEIASSSTPPAAQPVPLRPCPFCGGAANIERIGTIRQSMLVVCEDCGARVESGDVSGLTNPENYKWNHRAPDPSRAALVAALRDCLSTLSFYALGKQPSGLLRRGTVVKSPRLWATEAILAAEQALADGKETK